MTAPALDPAGNVTSARGFRAGAVYAGIKTYGEGKLDVAILASDPPCTVAATYTRARLHSASVDINRAKLAFGPARAVFVNAGVANSSTGGRGVADGHRVTEWTAAKLGIPAGEVLICSTGVIGHFLPLDRIHDGIGRLDLTVGGGDAFARAIMTTDTRPKHAAIRFGPYVLGGCCKGSGMIHPDMATMLAFLTTDAPVEQGFLQSTLSAAVDRSFNLVSVDGDTSPSDTVLLFANGAAGGETIDAASPLAATFQEAVGGLCRYLAREIARDGEGATRVIEVTVTGAASDEDARAVVRTLTTSYLLKSAVHGADPNWGRIVAAVGRTSVPYDEDEVAVDLCGVRVFEEGRPTADALERAADISNAMHADTVPIAVSLGRGPGAATGWGCDLSADYVTINADYHT
ncbi:MAG: bifunctional glutamate N-acetyltransferase/amino-acid acetyltransferase ArgJ [Dehalococcoidia bacterium]|nr:bifunctional glutamate N-acetyltransferase/amino-acid acetyltransferase ArgJ [Dehalococcoidia bacterium]